MELSLKPVLRPLRPAAISLAVLLPMNSEGKEFDSLSELVRTLPYSIITSDVYDNWMTVRGWVLDQSGPCSKPDRHIFVDLNGKFLTWMDNKLDTHGKTDSSKTNRKIQRVRRKIAEKRGIDYILDDNDKTPYPFAYSCALASRTTERAIPSYFGIPPESKIWGSWKGIEISKAKPISIRGAFRHVIKVRGYRLPASVLERLFGQYMIESGGQKNAHSQAGAKGILQLTKGVREHCGIPERHATNRIAQIDCAASELRRAYDYLKPKINSALRNIPGAKREIVTQWLTTQAYHTGMGNIAKMLGNNGGDARASGELNRHYREKYSDFSGEDLAMFLLAHNIGRHHIGPQSLKYGIDSQTAINLLEQYKKRKGIR